MQSNQNVFRIRGEKNKLKENSVCVVSTEDLLVNLTNLINNQQNIDRRLAKIERKMNGSLKTQD